MGLELAKAFVTVRVDGSQVGTGLQAVKRDVTQSMEAIRRAALGIIGTLAASSGNMLREGFAQAAKQESDFLAFEVLIGNAEEAEDLFKRLEQFGMDTPFEMPQLVNASRQMVTFGDRGEEVMENLLLLGNAAAGSNSRIEDLAMVFNQVRAAGKLLRQDFLQLANRGVISLKEIADHYGVNTAAANQMMADGKITFDDLKAILKDFSSEGGKFFKMMERQAKTFGGAWSNLQDVMSTTLKEIATNFLTVATRIVQATTAVLGVIRKVVAATGPLIPSIMAATVAVSSLTTAVLGLVVGLRLLGVTWRAFAIGTGIGAALVLLSVIIGTVAAGIQVLVREFMKAEGTQKVLEGVTRRLGAAWQIVKDVVSSLVGGIDLPSWGGQWITTLQGIATSISEFVLTATSWFKAIVDNWQLVWDNIGAVSSFAISYLFDIFLNLGELISQGVGFGIRKVAELLVQMAVTVASAFAALGHGIVNVLVSIPDIVRKVISGQDMGTAFQQLMHAPLENIKALMRGLQGEAPDLDSMFDMSARTQTKLEGLKDVLGKIKQDQVAIRSRAMGNKIEDFSEKGGEGEGGSDTAALEAGRYDFLEAGRKMQETMLAGGQGDAQQQMVGMLEAGNVTQDKLLKNSDDAKKEQQQMVGLMQEQNKSTKEVVTAIRDWKLERGTLT